MMDAYEALDYARRWCKKQRQKQKEVVQMKYVKKPIPIDAWCMGETITAPAWVQEAMRQGRVIPNGKTVKIETREGWVEADYGDWLIKGTEGEVYPCKASVFTATYDPIGEGD